ncbi:peroxisomal copper amine oxidase [Rickenella mellea]|uniref:Amine oxidase n=1 Tax=Rickenella mellea TaxID=50990 RepID=A0A4Y7PZK8_9AGAM|nr:peroxisomal copper amine oxidase [Rickenella mellea]
MAPVAEIPQTTEAHVPATATGALKTPRVGATLASHPLDPLSPDEIAAVSLAIRKYVAKETTIKAVKFITSSIIPPPKKDVLAILGIPSEPGKAPGVPKEYSRRGEVDFIDLVTGDAHNVNLTFKGSEWIIDTIEQLPEGTQPQISVEELIAAEQAIRDDPRVQALAKDVGILPEQIHADGWSIGYDDRFPKSVRVQQGLLFARFSKHDNLYAHPMDFIPVLDSNSMKVIHVDFPPHRDASSKLSTESTAPPPISEDPVTASKRDRIAPPKEAFDFLPDLIAQKEGESYKIRNDIKPLHVVQPEGVSFKIKGHELEWQKWKMHIAFSHREGIAISTITYNDNGEVRPIFYRLSLAEMVVPYAAPEFPHPRKFAFDAGEYGMGTMANDLTLGCDCLGQIHYLPGAFIGHDGSAIQIKNAICIHEEDAGLLWKHTDYRPGGRSQAARSRRLVVSMCCTLANYEYIWNYFFYQDGSIEFEIRLTGILQVYVKNPTEPNPFGTTVAPQINAHYHQHLFSLRVDPMVDGLNNSVIESDVIPLPNAPTGSVENFAGNAFIVQEKTLKVANEGARDFDYELDRRWRIVNPARTHYSSGAAPGYVIGMKGGATKLLARPDGWAARRAAFATKTLWVLPDKEGPNGGKVWPAGKYVPQTREEPEDSVGGWSRGAENIENDDILLFLTIGTTHIPRPEDWPVMPVDHLRVTFKPQSFFKMNPSLDVPTAKDPHSKAAFDDGVHDQHQNGANGGTCCGN